MPKRILITGARAPIALDLARKLAASGNLVYLSDSTRTPLSRVSNSIQKFFYLPKPILCARSYVEHLNKIALENKIDIIIPTCEEIFYIARFKHLINAQTHVFCDDFDKLYQLHSKWTFHQKVHGFNILSPRTHLLENFQEVKRQIQNTENYVFKPVFSRFAAKTLLSPTLDVVKALAISPPKPWIAQKRIYGKEYSSYSIAYQGELLLHSTYYCQYRAGKGAGIYFEPVNHEKIQNFVKAFVKKENFHGQISFDYMEDQNQCYVLECNPRATSGLHLIDNPEMVNNCFLGKKTLTERPASNTKKMLLFGMLLYALPKSLSLSKWKEVQRDYQNAQDVIFKKTDIWPSLYQFYSFFSILATSFLTGKPILEVTTGDIEYNGQAL